MSHGCGFNHCQQRTAILRRRLAGRPFPFLLPVLALGFWLHAGVLMAEPAALIITGISPSGEDAAKFLSLATETKRCLVQRGFAEGRVEILHESVTRELVLQKLRAVNVSTNDEFWLVLYGISGKARGNQPAFQISGPRLTAADLKTALDAIPARQFVFIGTGDSGGFLPVLQNDRRTVLSATREQGEPDRPRFLDAWVKSFGQNPRAPFAGIAARAAADVAAEYPKLHLAQDEHAQLADPATGKILDPPFGVQPEATGEKAIF